MIAAIFKDHDFASRHQDVIAEAMAAQVRREKGRHAGLTFHKGATPMKGKIRPGSMADKILKVVKHGRTYIAADVALLLGTERQKVSYALSDMVARGQMRRVLQKSGGATVYERVEHSESEGA